MQSFFYKDKEKRQLDPELFSGKAEALANLIYAESDKKLNNPTQIRQFYDEVLKFKNNKEDFDVLLPYVKMLNAKAAYKMARDLISKGFKDFISRSVKEINSREDLDVFADFFEAFMGFYKFKVETSKSSNKGGR
jgi:CRISPR-associated protein Csm2